jgi:hypothetical protein
MKNKFDIGDKVYYHDGENFMYSGVIEKIFINQDDLTAYQMVETFRAIPEYCISKDCKECRHMLYLSMHDRLTSEIEYLTRQLKQLEEGGPENAGCYIE